HHPLSLYSICSTLFPSTPTLFHPLPPYFHPHYPYLDILQLLDYPFIHIPSASACFWLLDHNTTQFLLITSLGGPYTVPYTSEACATHLTAWLPRVVTFGARHLGYIGSKSISRRDGHE
ncbi:hypothetical protein BT96DRAFT_925809, partial [Gymnopus androsaceus JB14]